MVPRHGRRPPTHRLTPPRRPTSPTRRAGNSTHGPVLTRLAAEDLVHNFPDHGNRNVRGTQVHCRAAGGGGWRCSYVVEGKTCAAAVAGTFDDPETTVFCDSEGNSCERVTRRARPDAWLIRHPRSASTAGTRSAAPSHRRPPRRAARSSRSPPSPRSRHREPSPPARSRARRLIDSASWLIAGPARRSAGTASIATISSSTHSAPQRETKPSRPVIVGACAASGSNRTSSSRPGQ